MKTLNIRFFAGLREALGQERQSLQTVSTSVEELVQELSELNPAFASWISRSQGLRVAINQELVTSKAPLHDQDEVAFFPPVTGG